MGPLETWLLGLPEVERIEWCGPVGNPWAEVILRDGRRGNLGMRLHNPESSDPDERRLAELLKHGVRALIVNASQPRHAQEVLKPRPLVLCGECGLPVDQSTAHDHREEENA